MRDLTDVRKAYAELPRPDLEVLSPLEWVHRLLTVEDFIAHGREVLALMRAEERESPESAAALKLLWPSAFALLEACASLLPEANPSEV